jgi:hypothetical protein
VSSQKNNCLKLGQDQVRPKRDMICHRKPVDDAQNAIKLPSKRTRRQPLKLSEDFLG